MVGGLLHLVVALPDKIKKENLHNLCIIMMFIIIFFLERIMTFVYLC